MRNRIIGHQQVRACDLIPHELNPRIHNQAQRDALNAIYHEIGYARSVLAYQLPDGRLKLIDGHLRTSEHAPDDLIDVEVLDVTDAEARKLLLTIDPLASLANYSDDTLLKIRDITIADNEILNALWAGLHQTEPVTETKDKKAATTSTQWLIIIECTSESQQATQLTICQREKMHAKAVSS